jgi:hypothetical protein
VHVLLEQLKQVFADELISKLEVVQSLWSGYGEIARYHSPRLGKNIIVKQVSPPAQVSHPRGWNTQNSHLRKLKSYQVESEFYRYYADKCDENCKVPGLLACIDDGVQCSLVLEDLDVIGFTARRSGVTIAQSKLAIRWLAYFHARFFNIAAQTLWPVGTYWHLATRQDEWAAMPEGDLKQGAAKISGALNSAKFQTLVHGDGKLANFCFHHAKPTLAAVDFQYVGKGAGIVDLAYLLGGCFSDEDLFKHEKPLLTYYFAQLAQGLKHYKIDCDFRALETEWRLLYPLAWADFYRFLQGWSPGHDKINAYMHHQGDVALSYLRHLSTQE